MKKWILLVALGGNFVLTQLAQAHRCPHGQIRRISLGVCVGIHSRLAREVYHVRVVRAAYHVSSIRHRHNRSDELACDPQTMCGDPIEDRVVDAPSSKPEPEPVLPWPSSRLNPPRPYSWKWLQ